MLPKGDDSTLVSEIASQTLTNKTLTSPTITGTGSIAGVFSGDLTGDVTGDVTGDLTGNVNGNLTGTVLTTSQNSITTMTGLTAVGSANVATVFEYDIQAKGKLIAGSGSGSGQVMSNGAHNLIIKTGGTGGTITLNEGTNQPITLSPHGTGRVETNCSLAVGPWNTENTGNSVLTTYGVGNLKLQTTNGASVQIKNDSSTPTGNADIIMTPKGTGKVDIQGPVATTGVTTTGNVTMTGKFIKQF